MFLNSISGKINNILFRKESTRLKIINFMRLIYTNEVLLLLQDSECIKKYTPEINMNYSTNNKAVKQFHRTDILKI